MDNIPLHLIFPVVGAIVAGEALALIIGMLIIKKGNSPWNIARNRKYLYADLFIGIVLILNSNFNENLWYTIVVAISIIVAIATHFFRVGEYLLKKPNAFCANTALFVVNNLKLVLLFGLLFALIPF